MNVIEMHHLNLAIVTLLAGIVSAQECSTTITPPRNIKPSVASGFRLAVVATGLTSPRSLQFDSNGNLLIVEQEKRISSHVLQDDGGTCVRVKSSKDLINDENVSASL